MIKSWHWTEAMKYIGIRKKICKTIGPYNYLIKKLYALLHKELPSKSVKINLMNVIM